MTSWRRFEIKCSAVMLLLLMGFPGLAQAANLPPAKPLVVPVLPYEKYTLPNGLDVILYENHKLPLVAVDLWYHVGPVNEKPGRHRLCPPLRAHDVRGLGACRREGAFQIP